MAALPHSAAARDFAGAPPSRAGVRVALGAAAALATGALLAGHERLGRWAGGFLDAYVAAQQKMLAATGNVTADGRSEFAVLLADGATAESLRGAMAGVADVSFARVADLDGWVIVTTTPGNRAGLKALRALPEARLVVPNRGLWICH